MAFYTLQMVVIAVTLPWFTSAQIDGFRLADGDSKTFGVLVLQDGMVDRGLVCYDDSYSSNTQLASLVCKELGFTFSDEVSQAISHDSINENSLLQLDRYSFTCNSAEHAVCPSGMTLVAGSCYKFFSTETYPLAVQTSCSGGYGGLARITSADISALKANFDFKDQMIWVIKGNNAAPSSNSGFDICDALDSGNSGEDRLITLPCDQGKGYLCGFTPVSQWFDECQFQPMRGDCAHSRYFGPHCEGPVETSCANRCTTQKMTRWACQCNNECVRFGDCCSDFLEQCTYPSIQGNDGTFVIDGGVVNIDEGIVVILEKNTNDVVGYVCHDGHWLTSEAAAVCRALGFQQEAEQKYIDLPLTPSRTVIYSYIACLPGEETLADCTYSSSFNMTTNCSAIAGVACNVASTTPSTSTEHVSSKTNDTDVVDISTQATTNTEGNQGGTGKPSTILTQATANNEGNQTIQSYVYIVIACVVVVITLIIAALLLIYYRKRKSKGSNYAPSAATVEPTVGMTTITSDQSDDPAALSALTSHEPLFIGENEYITEPGLPPGADYGSTTDYEYAYVDPPPPVHISTNPSDTYSEIIPAHARTEPTSIGDGGDYGLIDNVLYGAN